MSLGIFSFDLEALISSLSCYFETAEPEPLPAGDETSLEKTEDVLEGVFAAEAKINDSLMAAAINSTVTSVMATETVKNPAPSSPTTKTPVRVPSPTLDERKKKELEDLIRSLQTSIVHNYRSTDIIDEMVSLNNVANFPKREIPKDLENSSDKLREQRKLEDRKLENLRDELRRAMIKNNSDV